MKIALAQINPRIGDIDRNLERMAEFIGRARDAKADLVVFPEQSVLGYPAKDLLLRREVIARNVAAIEQLAAQVRGIAVVAGYAEPNDAAVGRPVYNTAALLIEGKIYRSRKRLLPTYDVFDEARYFEPGTSQPVINVGGQRIGVSICEDMWTNEALAGHPLYDCDPIGDLVAGGASLLLNISASPYFIDKHPLRVTLLAEHARRVRRPIVFVNQVGGNDELLFDGASCVVDADGRIIAQAKSFEEDMLFVEIAGGNATPARIDEVPAGVAGVRAALVMGLRDYMSKCGFKSAVVGLSGGIDSALVAALAAEAIGAANVLGVAMPSRYSSAHSIDDAKVLATNLGIRLLSIPIEPIHAAFEAQLAEAFTGRAADVTEENIQARARGTLLMALSNKFGSLLLTTGNKSEIGVGYCTLYGDMCGGLAVISDVPKTMVYAISRHINASSGRPIIPESTLTKPPSAELRPNQTDQDSLPPYDVLDAILQRYEERLETIDDIVAAGFERRIVEDVVRKIHLSEYKRQQAAPGLKVTSRAFGFGRRMPIAAKSPMW